MRVMAVVALAAGFVATPMVTAGGASADACDTAACVPYVQHNAAQGASCSIGTRYVFGMDSAGHLLICDANGDWTAQPTPLVGVRNEREPCDNNTKGWAQSPDGLPLTCIAQGWTQNYSAVYFPASS